ncbi:MAG: tRNA-dihydrouridine synthase family protein [Bacteroidales bacterium]|nr:tRNA-dihydrouridine synthase family protein [Bacteroidales bacterium]
MGIQSIIPKIKTQDTVVFSVSLFSSEDRLILAPMQNLTSAFFRKTFNDFFPSNIDSAVSPFISTSSSSQNINSSVYRDILKEENNNYIELVPQILGHCPTAVAQCAAIIERLGYREVNINMGCPKKDIVNHDRGAGLLRRADLVKQIIENILTTTNLQISLKVRLGINNSTELQNLVPVINSYPLKSVTVHSRTQVQQYQGRPNLDEFERFALQIKPTVVYNGDIFSAEDFTKLKMRFPFIKHWMIGRGILQNPFLCADIRNIPYNKQQTLLPYLTALQDNFAQSLMHPSETAVLNKMKEMVKYLSVGFRFETEELLHTEQLADFNFKLKQQIENMF